MRRKCDLVRGLTATLLVGITLLAISACGDDKSGDSANNGGPNTGPTVPLELQPQPEVVQELDEELTVAFEGVIRVATADLLFSPNQLTMTAGETVVVRVTNSDTVAHNLRIAGLDGQYDTEDDALTVPETIGAGETGELNFSPQAKGEYTFRCDFHPGSMGGQVVVR